MPFTDTIDDLDADTTGSPLRGKRNMHSETPPVPAAQVVVNGPHEGGRQAASTAPPALRSAHRVLVLHEPGEAGLHVLAHAVVATTGPLVVLHAWDGIDPTRLAPIGSAGPAVYRSILEDNERARSEALERAQVAAAIAQEAGREAIGLERRLPHRSTLDDQLRLLVSRHGARQLVLAAPRRGRIRRLLRLRSPQERLAADPPCALTLVPVPGT